MLADIPLIPIAILLVLIAAAIGFALYFLRPAVKLQGTLDVAISKLKTARKVGQTDLAACFADDEKLRHIWTEFKETLHTQTAIDPVTGSRIEIAVRSTVPAEAFFSTQAVVDGTVHTEFFKHLPGIFTGIGIIGTFGGLIKGLSTFQISEDPNVVRNSLTVLLHGVSEAFLVSAVAITFAMIATIVEKLFLNRLYGKVETLYQLLDAAYEAGAGEEYLSRLVNASEESASQTRILKDALVSDLKDILTDLTERQIAATSQGNADLGNKFSEIMTGALKGPLDQIAGAVGQVSQDQSSAVSKLLTDVLASFSQKLESMFGDQLSGISEMQRRTIDALETAVLKLQEMSSNVETAGSRATEAMAKKLSDAMEAAEVRQAALNAELSKALGEMRTQAGGAQAETQVKVQEMIATLGTQLGLAVAELQSQAAARANEQSERELRHSKETAENVDRLGTHVGSLTTGVDRALDAVTQKLADVTQSAEDRQAALNNEFRAALSHVRTETENSQAATQAKVQETIASLGEQVGLAVADMQKQAAARSEEQAQRESQHSRITSDNVERIGAHVGSLTTGVDEVLGSVSKMIEKLERVTTGVTSSMNAGAETLLLAASKFETSAREASESFSKMASVSTGLSGAADSVAGAARSLDSVMSDYRAARDAVASTLETAKVIVENAARDASMTSDVLGRIESAAQKLAVAQEQADGYLETVSEVLGESHQRFSDGMRQTVGEANKAFHVELTQATGLLREAIQELELALPTGARKAA